MVAARYLSSLLCLAIARCPEQNGGVLFKALFDTCKLLYALKSRMDIVQVGGWLIKSENDRGAPILDAY